MIASPSGNLRSAPALPARVPSSLDLCLLYDWQTGPDFDTCCNSILQHLRNEDNVITRATRRPSYLDLHSDGARLLIESFNPAQIAHLQRPACLGPDRLRRGLSEAHARSNTALRLRVAAGFDDRRLGDLLGHLISLVSPAALVLMDTNIVLTQAEFRAASLAQLAQIIPGQALAQRCDAPMRHPSVFAAPPHKPMELAAPLDAGRAAKLCAVLADEFRNAPRWSWIGNSKPGQCRIGVLSSRDGALHMDPARAITGTLRIRTKEPRTDRVRLSS
ncbi:MAG: hypothetical protein EA339_06905 [Rhodobacteraceae bacterium]|nr:MAG: hypothetical protein EA339_06905 [Paracoccaceae bacterium]